MNIYELYGRKEEQLQVAIAEHLRTIKVLKSLKDGELKLKDIEVRVDGWNIPDPKLARDK